MPIVEKKALIIWPNNGINYNVCTLVQKSSTEGFSYEFIPNYRVLDLINDKDFDGIQGIDLSKRKEKYCRDFIPCFIGERVPPENRINIRHIFGELDLDYYDPLEIILRSKNKYCGDSLLITNFEEPKTIKLSELITGKKNTDEEIYDVLQCIASNNDITDNNKKINVKSLYNNYVKLYKITLRKNIKMLTDSVDAISNTILSVGRPKIKVNKQCEQIFEMYKTKDLTLDQSLTLTGMSRRTFFRKYGEYFGK